MKLNENQTKIIKFLVSQGMKEELSQNPDAVSRILMIADSKLDNSRLNVYNPEHVQALSGIIDEQGRIKESSKQVGYKDQMIGVMGNEINATQKTTEKEAIIDVNEAGQTVVLERILETEGYGLRNPEDFPINVGKDAIQYPYGPVLGKQSEKSITLIIEEGAQVDYSEVNYDRLFVIKDDSSIPADLKNGQYYDGRTDLRKLREYGVCAENGLADVINDVGKFFRLARCEDLTTADITVAVGNSEKPNYPTDSSLSKELYSDGVKEMPPVIVNGDDLSTFAQEKLRYLPFESHDIHEVRKEDGNYDSLRARDALRHYVDAFRNNRDNQSKIIYNSPSLLRLAKKRGLIKDNYMPESVEFYDHSADLVINLE